MTNEFNIFLLLEYLLKFSTRVYGCLVTIIHTVVFALTFSISTKVVEPTRGKKYLADSYDRAEKKAENFHQVKDEVKKIKERSEIFLLNHTTL